MKKKLFNELLESVGEGAKMLKKSRFPKQIFVAAEGPYKKGGEWFYGAGAKIADLFSYIDKNGELEVATYELVEVKILELEEKE